jgi:hypothetical protein
MRYVIHLGFTKLEESMGPESKQADTNGNGFVEFMELVEYARKKVAWSPSLTWISLQRPER